MKRKVFVTAVILGMLCLAAGGTYAYYTVESQPAHNVITTGEINIELIELDEKGEPFEDKEGVFPGQTVTKIPMVKNAGEKPAFVRVRLSKDILLKDGTRGDDSLISIDDINNTQWKLKDGYYYYYRVLQPGELTEPLFTKVSFASSIDNRYMGASAHVSLWVYAVQQDNNGNDPFTAKGWPEE